MMNNVIIFVQTFPRIKHNKSHTQMYLVEDHEDFQKNPRGKVCSLHY